MTQINETAIRNHFNKITDNTARIAAKLHFCKMWGAPADLDAVTGDIALDWALTTYPESPNVLRPWGA